MTATPVPSFYLYGEPQRVVDHGFVHVESLDHRNRPNEWRIQPHAHETLAQIFVIERGGGRMTAEDRRIACSAPALVLVPARTVHGFDWDPSVRGSVLTLSSDYLAELYRADATLRHVFASARVVGVGPADMASVSAAAERLARELSWRAPGHRAAVKAGLLTIAVVALRHLRQSDDAAPLSAATQLVARLRERIEDRFRLREPVADHAAALGVSPSTLRSACAQAADAAPMALLDERTVLEAKRTLIYSSNGVAEIAYALGFADPAYFSRFFARATGMSPRTFRLRRGHAVSSYTII